jgi:hypothetical protein
VPGHEGIVGKLARTGSEHPFTGPKPACSISIQVAKKVVWDSMYRNHKKKGGIQNWTQIGKGTYTRALC